MTKEETIKALQCCVSGTCFDCPAKGNGCSRAAMESAIHYLVEPEICIQLDNEAMAKLLIIMEEKGNGNG